MAIVRVFIHRKYIFPTLDASGTNINADFNEQIESRVNDGTKLDVNRGENGDIFFFDAERFTLADFILGTTGNGGSQFDDLDIQFYNPYIKVLTTNMGENVPSGVPNATYPEVGADGNLTGVILNNTWTSWINTETYTITVVANHTYFLANAGTTGNVTMTLDELKAVHAGTHSELVDIIPEP